MGIFHFACFLQSLEGCAYCLFIGNVNVIEHTLSACLRLGIQPAGTIVGVPCLDIFKQQVLCLCRYVCAKFEDNTGHIEASPVGNLDGLAGGLKVSIGS